MRNETKREAQDRILQAVIGAFYALEDEPELTRPQKDEMYAAMDAQFRRVERLFGYEPGSWGRG